MTFPGYNEEKYGQPEMWAAAAAGAATVVMIDPEYRRLAGKSAKGLAKVGGKLVRFGGKHGARLSFKAARGAGKTAWQMGKAGLRATSWNPWIVGVVAGATILNHTDLDNRAMQAVGGFIQDTAAEVVGDEVAGVLGDIGNAAEDVYDTVISWIGF